MAFNTRNKMKTLYQFYCSWDAVDYFMACVTAISLVFAIIALLASVHDDYRYCRAQRRAGR
jgi:hypothetical protein